jgi:O-antigen/teichoic acid export membrane protein
MTTIRTRMAAWNLATGLLFTALTMVTGLLATPWLIQWLGKEPFGDARMLVEIFGYLTLLELGLGGGLGPVLARALASGDKKALRGALSAGMRVYLIATAATLTVGMILVATLTRIIPVDPQLAGNLRWAGVITLLGFATLALSPVRALAEAEQRGFRVNLLLSGQALIITAAALIFARAGAGIAGQSAATVLGTVLVSLALTGEALRRHPGLLRDLWKTPPDPEAARGLGRLSLMVLIVQLSGRLSFMTDSYIAGHILGSAVVASLFATQRLAQLVLSQLQMVGNAAWAGLAELYGRGEHGAFNARLIELSRLIVILSLTALAPIVAYNHKFVNIWMRGRDVEYGGDLLILAASIGILLQGLFSLWGWCFTGTGQLHRVAPAQLVSALVNLAASIALTRWLGLAGPVLGTLFAFVTINVWYFPLQLHRTFATPLGSLAKAVAWPLAWGLAYGAALWNLTRVHQPAGWVGLVVEMSLAALGFLALAWALLLTPAERVVWQRRLLGLRPRARVQPANVPPPASLEAQVVSSEAR